MWLASLFAIVATRRRCSLVSRLVSIAVFICAIGFGIAACGGETYDTSGGGGGDPGTPIGTYTITLTGTANGTSQPFPLTLTVD
jgi:hypothetical protein